MTPARILVIIALLGATAATQTSADRQIAEAKLEQAIIQKPELRGSGNRQTVRDDQEYAWLSDESGRARNDALFARP
jgi:hypothetical protein